MKTACARLIMRRERRAPPIRLRMSVLALFAASFACRAPKRDYDVAQIAQVTSMKELMRVQRTVADPRFKLAAKMRGKPLGDAEFAEFLDMGTRLEATAKRLASFSEGRPGFDKYAADLGKQAADLGRAARAKNGPDTTSAALAMKKTCAACHGEFR